MPTLDNPFSQDARISSALGRVARAFIPDRTNAARDAYYMEQARALKDQRDTRADLALRPEDTPLSVLFAQALGGGLDPREVAPFIIGREAVRRGPDGGFAADEETLSRLIYGTTGRGLGYREAATASGRDAVMASQQAADRDLALAVQDRENDAAMARLKATPLTLAQAQAYTWQNEMSPLARTMSLGPTAAEADGAALLAAGQGQPVDPRMERRLFLAEGRGGAAQNPKLVLFAKFAQQYGTEDMTKWPREAQAAIAGAGVYTPERLQTQIDVTRMRAQAADNRQRAALAVRERLAQAANEAAQLRTETLVSGQLTAEQMRQRGATARNDANIDAAQTRTETIANAGLQRQQLADRTRITVAQMANEAAARAIQQQAAAKTYQVTPQTVVNLEALIDQAFLRPHGATLDSLDDDTRNALSLAASTFYSITGNSAAAVSRAWEDIMGPDPQITQPSLLGRLFSGPTVAPTPGYVPPTATASPAAPAPAPAAPSGRAAAAPAAPPVAQPAVPPAAGAALPLAIGATATNPQTGERIQWDGRRWIPVP